MAAHTEYPTPGDVEAAAQAIYECRWFPDKWIDCHPGTRTLCLKEAEAGLRAVRPAQAEPVPAVGADKPDSVRETAWRCFHCDEVFTETDAAADHFGAAEGERPACVAMLTETEKAIVEDRREWKRRAQRAENAVDELGLRLARVEAAIQARWKGARTIEDVIRLYDQSDGRALVAGGEAGSAEADLGATTRILGEALVLLLNVNEADFGRPAAADRDEEPVGSFSDGKMALTFGHLRRAREALDKASASANRPSSESDSKSS